jgi:hypothetical protein
MMANIERLLPHPAYGHLLPNGEGDTNQVNFFIKINIYAKRQHHCHFSWWVANCAG